MFTFMISDWRDPHVPRKLKIRWFEHENKLWWQEYQSWTEVDDQPESSHRLLLLKKSVRVGQRVAEAIRRHPAFCPKSLLCNIGNDEIAWNRQPAIVLRAIQLYM